MFAVEDFSEPAQSFLERYTETWNASDAFRDGERLREETFNLAHACDPQFIIFVQLVNTENGGGIVKVLE